MEKNLIKNKDFILLIIGKVISFIGTRMNSFAFALYVLTITGSGSKFASILIVGIIPQIILTPVCGVLADWLDRKKIMVYIDSAMAILFTTLSVIAFISTINLTHIYIAVILGSICQALYNPAAGAAIPSLVEKELLVKANSIDSTVTTLGGLIAPAIAAAIYGIFGIKIILLLNAISFIIASIMEAMINLKTEVKKLEGNVYKEFFNDFKIGFDFIVGNNFLKYIMIFCFFINGVLGGSMSVGIPFICKIVLKISDMQFGLTETAMVFGSLIGALLSPMIAKKISLERLFSLVILGCGILLFLVGIVVNSNIISVVNNLFVTWILFLLILTTFTIIATFINISMGTMMQKLTPNNMLGRVMATGGTIAIIAMPFGQVIYGVLFDKVITFYIFVVSAAILTTIALISFKVLKAQDENLVAILEE
ncbi:Transmembrane secretion effector [Clostridium cavendishii DSM 21758]|uniref:Transmembrane secretion effector n=1 Tax=Clostridium cavendishii DSM 21758 TaxID=1121302 RepID=A0A1M6CG01_9CLOT|nr:MFS transporter [Clostridium cavendishii]SHI59942.1 Transmembrane secretion effector [Clostridium cavendishii DSM 21758]